VSKNVDVITTRPAAMVWDKLGGYLLLTARVVTGIKAA
jgi:hypothetical protein